MKTKMIPLLVIGQLLTPFSLMAGEKGGWGSGNGEFLHACKKGKNGDDYKVLEIWDFYETRKANPKTFEVSREWSSTVYQQASQAIKKIEKVNSSYAAIVKREFEFMIQPGPGIAYSDKPGMDLLEDLDTKVFKNSWLQLVEGPLKATTDTSSYIDKGQNCEQLQLVNYPEYLDPNLDPATLGLDERIKIDRNLWKTKKEGIFSDSYLLHKTDKAAVLLHEAIYKVERDLFNAIDSKHTRQVIALLFQKNPENFDATLASKLIPTNSTLFTDDNFDYEAVRKFFHIKGKFSSITPSDLLDTQWDLYGTLNRDGRNSLEMFYSPEKAVTPFAQGKRPKLIFMKDGLVFPDSIFQDETCRKNVLGERQDSGCIGRYRIDEKGQLGFGQLESVVVEEQYSFPSVDCKLSYSRNVLLCESLSHTGDTFFTLFYRQNKKMDYTKTRGLYRLVSEIYPNSRIFDYTKDTISSYPQLLLRENGEANTFNFDVLTAGLGFELAEKAESKQWLASNYQINGNRLVVDMTGYGSEEIISLNCEINPLQDTLICWPSFAKMGVKSPARLVFQIAK